MRLKSSHRMKEGIPQRANFYLELLPPTHESSLYILRSPPYFANIAPLRNHFQTVTMERYLKFDTWNSIFANGTFK